MQICLFEYNGVENLGPLALARPAFDLRTGARSLLERQLDLFGTHRAGALVRPLVAELCQQTHPHLTTPAWSPGELLVLVNARWLPPAELPRAEGSVLGVVGDQVAYVVLAEAPSAAPTARELVRSLDEWRDTLPARPAGGWMIDYPWDLVERNGDALELDYRHWRGNRERARVPEGVVVVGPSESLCLDPQARVEPLAVLDTTRGPVLIDRGAVVQAFSRVEGPCYVGPDSQVLGARIRGGSIGPDCRVGGEVEASVLHGHANKYHDGFLGHSYVGEWVNLAAGTQVSDLRTDYAPVSVTLAGRRVDTGLIKVGAYLGDHTRTSLNTLFNTGTVAGPFDELLSSGALLPRVLPPFCRFGHGQVQERTDLRQMFATAATVMARRGREWTAAHAELYFALYEETAADRRRLIRENDQRRLRRVV